MLISTHFSTPLVHLLYIFQSSKTKKKKTFLCVRDHHKLGMYFVPYFLIAFKNVLNITSTYTNGVLCTMVDFLQLSPDHTFMSVIM